MDEWKKEKVVETEVEAKRKGSRREREGKGGSATTSILGRSGSGALTFKTMATLENKTSTSYGNTRKADLVCLLA